MSWSCYDGPMAGERYWRVVFTADGKAEGATEIEGPGDAEWVVVSASSVEEALQRGVRRYACLKKKKRIARLYAEGKCSCGRVQDRPGCKTCSVCEEHRKRYRHPPADGQPRVRDEGARVLAFQETNRNRKQEVRIEVLLEVRKWWRDAPHTEAFIAKLAGEIEAAGGRDRMAG